MAIGTNSIIHYTKTLETLIAILGDLGFKYKYCSEKIVTRGNHNYSFAIAMVSFCDIPLSDYKKHFLKNSKRSDDNLGYYGDYGIGLSGRWSEINGLNPVMYIDKNSHLSTSLRHSAENLLKNETLLENLNTNLYTFYTKNVKGQLKRVGKSNIEGYRFYDEREWRYVPSKAELRGVPRVLNNSKYLSEKDLYNSKISRNRLKFSIEDITYIII